MTQPPNDGSTPNPASDDPYGPPAEPAPEQTPGGQPAYGAQPPWQVGQQGYPSQYPGGFAAGYPNPAMRRNSLGTAGMVCGIVGIVLSWLGVTLVGAVVPATLGILAIIFGVIGRNRCKRNEATNRGAATAGLITGIVGVVFTVVAAIIAVVVFASIDNQVDDCVSHGYPRSFCEDHYNDFAS